MAPIIMCDNVFENPDNCFCDNVACGDADWVTKFSVSMDRHYCCNLLPLPPVPTRNTHLKYSHLIHHENVRNMMY